MPSQSFLLWTKEAQPPQSLLISDAPDLKSISVAPVGPLSSSSFSRLIIALHSRYGLPRAE